MLGRSVRALYTFSNRVWDEEAEQLGVLKTTVVRTFFFLIE